MEQREFVVVTDGSDGEFDMLFGWEICTLNGDGIAEHAGPAFGVFPLCNGVYSINKAIKRPTVSRQHRSDNTNSTTTIISS
eukprot:2783699-Ditylum_brightwellii.AAC.1